MKHTLRVAAAILVAALLSTLLVALEPSAGADTPAAGSGVVSGARWMAGRLSASGTVAGPGGGVDWDTTAQVVLALAGTGHEQAAATSAADALAAHVDEYVKVGGVDQPGRLARLVQIAVALGRTPTAFGNPATDLVSRLLATQVTTGPDAGLFGTPNVYASSFLQGLALQALAAVGRSNAAGTAWLVAQQCADGSWMGYRASTVVPCAFDPVTFVGPDTNSTAVAELGLLAQKVAPLHDVVAYFDATQTAGGWSFDGSPTAADPNSTALAVQVIRAAGQDPAGTRFTVGGTTAAAALAAFQLGCDAPAAQVGAFWFDSTTKAPDLLSSVQALPALAGSWFPLGPVTFSASTAPGCPAPTTTTAAPTTTPPASTLGESSERLAAFVVFAAAVQRYRAFEVFAAAVQRLRVFAVLVRLAQLRQARLHAVARHR